MTNDKYGYRTMYLKDKSLFFIETVIHLMKNLFKTIYYTCWKNYFGYGCCTTGDQQKCTKPSQKWTWEGWVSFGWFVSILIWWKAGQVGQISLSNILNQCSLVHPWQGCVLSLTRMTFFTWISRVVIVQMGDRNDDCQVCPGVYQPCLCWKIIHEVALLQMSSVCKYQGTH